MSISIEQVRNLGSKYLNDKGYELLEKRLDEDDIEQAKIVLLGAFDALWMRKEISDAEARVLYKELGLSPEKVSKIRQENGKI